MLFQVHCWFYGIVKMRVQCSIFFHYFDEYIFSSINIILKIVEKISTSVYRFLFSTFVYKILFSCTVTEIRVFFGFELYKKKLRHEAKTSSAIFLKLILEKTIAHYFLSYKPVLVRRLSTNYRK